MRTVKKVLSNLRFHTGSGEVAYTSYKMSGECGFCHRPGSRLLKDILKQGSLPPTLHELGAMPFDLKGPVQVKSGSRTATAQYHYLCADWSPLVDCLHDGTLLNVGEEIKRGSRL
eukprot:g71321.t1